MTLSEPDAAFLDAVADVWTSILAPAALEEGGDHCRADDPTLITTGPFVIDEWIPGQSLSFTARDDYDWAPGYAAHTGRAYVDEATYRFLPEATVRTGALTADQVDIIENVQVTDTQVFEDVARASSTCAARRPARAFSLNINVRQAPADDVRVRRALRDGVDLDAIVRGPVPRHGRAGVLEPRARQRVLRRWFCTCYNWSLLIAAFIRPEAGLAARVPRYCPRTITSK